MKNPPSPRASAGSPKGRGGPVYELRVQGLRGGDIGLEIWQLPSPATPRLAAPERMAALRGRALETIEARLLRRLKAEGISLAGVLRDSDRTWD